VTGQLRGLAHAHAGWLLRDDPTPPSRYAPDMLADPAMRAVSAAFPALCVLSLALPFGAGWLIGGTWRTALAALLWAGLVRVALLQHVTWSVNSLCHVFGSRPFATRRHDRATNLWPLALLSFGESWHNMHHSDPACARHGVDPGEVDISAAVIRVFERLGWATKVRWPTPARLDSRRRGPGQDQQRPGLGDHGRRRQRPWPAGYHRCPPATTVSGDGHRRTAIGYRSAPRAAHRPTGPPPQYRPTARDRPAAATIRPEDLPHRRAGCPRRRPGRRARPPDPLRVVRGPRRP